MERLLNWLVVWWMDAIAQYQCSDQVHLTRFCTRLLEREATGECWGEHENAELR